MPLPTQTFATITQLINYINTYVIPNGDQEIIGEIENNVENALANFIVSYTLNSDEAALVSTGGVVVLPSPISVITTVVPTTVQWIDNVQNEYYIVNTTNSVIPLAAGFSYYNTSLVAQTSIPVHSAIHIAKATNGLWIQLNASATASTTMSARNGASVDADGYVVLGNSVGESPALGTLLDDREIPLNGFTVTFLGNSGNVKVFDDGSFHSNSVSNEPYFIWDNVDRRQSIFGTSTNDFTILNDHSLKIIGTHAYLGDFGGNEPTFIEFGNPYGGNDARMFVGWLGTREFNFGYNLNYRNQVHRYVDNSQDIMYSFLSPDNFGFQGVGKGYPNTGDVFNEHGKVPFRIDFIKTGVDYRGSILSTNTLYLYDYTTTDQQMITGTKASFTVASDTLTIADIPVVDFAPNINVGIGAGSTSNWKLELSSNSLNGSAILVQNTQNNTNGNIIRFLKNRAGNFNLGAGTKFAEFDINGGVAAYGIRATSTVLGGFSNAEYYWNTTNAAGSAADRMVLNQEGNLRLNHYPNSRNDGATTQALYTDASGNVLLGPVSASAGFADDGLSVTSGVIKLGQAVGAVGNPAGLTEDRQIPLNTFAVQFTGNNMATVIGGYFVNISGDDDDGTSPILRLTDGSGNLASLNQNGANFDIVADAAVIRLVNSSGDIYTNQLSGNLFVGPAGDDSTYLLQVNGSAFDFSHQPGLSIRETNSNSLFTILNGGAATVLSYSAAYLYMDGGTGSLRASMDFIVDAGHVLIGSLTDLGTGEELQVTGTGIIWGSQITPGFGNSILLGDGIVTIKANGDDGNSPVLAFEDTSSIVTGNITYNGNMVIDPGAGSTIVANLAGVGIRALAVNAGGVLVAGAVGVSGSFTAGANTVTVVDGIITAIT